MLECELGRASLLAMLILALFLGGFLSDFIHATLILQHGLNFLLLFLLHALNLLTLFRDGRLQLAAFLGRAVAHFG